MPNTCRNRMAISVWLRRLPVALSALASPGWLSAADGSATPTTGASRSSPDDVPNWIARLDSEQFSEREAATRALAALGAPAIDALRAVAENDDAETSWRAILALTRIWESALPADSVRAYAALQGVARSGSAASAAPAADALRSMEWDLIGRQMKLKGSRFDARFLTTPVRAVDLNHTTVTDADVAQYCRLPTVEHVYLDGTCVTSAALDHLLRLPRVTTLMLMDTDVDDNALARITQLRSLRLVSLHGTRVTDAAGPSLAQCQLIEQLWLSDTAITDGALRPLSGLAGLRTLQLNGCGVSDAGIAELRPLEHLHELGLERTRVRWELLPSASPAFPQLRVLWLNATPVSDDGLAAVARLPALEKLYLVNTTVGDDGAAALADVSGLQALYFTNARITDAGIRRLGQLTGLRELSIHGTRATDQCLTSLSGLVNLRWLFVGNTAISPAGIEQLKKALPGCQIFTSP